MAGYAEKYLPPIFKDFRNRTGAWLHKNKDGKGQLGEHGPDYFLALTGTQIEVKNSERDGTLTDGPSELQTKLLNEHGGYIFLVMWDKDYPRLPDGADAYLIPWTLYRDWWNDWRLTKKVSFRRHSTERSMGVDGFFKNHQLPWVSGGHWAIPQDHPSHFWNDLRAKVANLLFDLNKGDL
jgi:hypothetical protein